MKSLAGLLFALATQDVAHEVRVEPAAVEVGQPFDVVCDVTHPEGARPRAVEPDFFGSDPWVLFDARRELLADGATRLVWTLACLEPGPETELPELGYSVLIDGRERVAFATGHTLAVAGVLAEGEDAPRPQVGFRSLAEEPAPAPAWRRWAVWGAVLASTLLLVAVYFLARAWRAARRRPKPAPRPVARLGELEQADLSQRARHYELARLVREGIDEEAGRDRRGLTDEEWLAALDDVRIPERAKVEAGAALERCAAVKFGAAKPTDWAVEETFAHARQALATLEEEEV